MIEHESSMKRFLIFVLVEVFELLYAQKGTSFRLFTNEKETGPELAFEKTAGIVGTSGILDTGDAPVSYWSIFSLSPIRDPEVFAKVNSAHASMAHNEL